MTIFEELKRSLYLCLAIKVLRMAKNMNRIKVVLAEKNLSNRRLVEQLHKDSETISKWCTNMMQSNIETLFEIAECLGVDSKRFIMVVKRL